jgi:hypothetical protein
MRSLHRRRAVSGAISAMFVVLIFMMAMVAIYMYQTYYDAYLDEVHARNQMDCERNNEKLLIVAVERRKLDATLNVTVQNLGPIAVHLTTIWVSAYDGDYQKYQYQYGIKYDENPERGGVWFDSAETLTNLGQQNDSRKKIIYSPYRLIDTYTVPGVLQVTNEPYIVLADPTWHYIIKLETARGNVFVGDWNPTIQTVEWSDGRILITLDSGSGMITMHNVGSRDLWITGAYIVLADAQHTKIDSDTLGTTMTKFLAKNGVELLHFNQLSSGTIVLSGYDDLGKPYFQTFQVSQV